MPEIPSYSLLQTNPLTSSVKVICGPGRHSSNLLPGAETAGRDSLWHCCLWETVRKLCPSHHLSYQPCLGRPSRRANEASLNFRKCFFCFSSSLTTGSSTSPCSLSHRCLPAPRLLPNGHTVLCGLTSHCSRKQCVLKEDDARGKGMCLPSFGQRLGTEKLLFGCKKKLVPHRNEAEKYQRAGRVSGLGDTTNINR